MLNSLIYLNSANLSLCPPHVLRAITQYQNEFERNPTRGLAEVWGKLWGVQKELAEFLRADPQDLFLRENVTSVLNAFVLGIPLPPKSEILIGELEYGAISNICRMRAERDGLNFRVFRMPMTPPALKDLTEDKLVEDLVSQCSPQTKILLVSHVVAGTGMVVPIQKLAAETRKRGIILIVDGAYAPGAIPVDFSEYDDVDFYGCSLYKWMLGPKGTGFGWVNPRHHDTLLPSGAGWTTYDIHGPFAKFGDGNRFQHAFLMKGCRDFAPFLALHETLALWKEEGSATIRARLKGLQFHLRDEVEKQLGWKLLESSDESLNGPMLVYRLPDAWQPRGETLAEEILRKLNLQIHVVALRERWHLAFSPHIYNSKEEISEGIGRLAKYPALFLAAPPRS